MDYLNIALLVLLVVMLLFGSITFYINGVNDSYTAYFWRGVMVFMAFITVHKIIELLKI